jgi:hypothetical protein
VTSRVGLPSLELFGLKLAGDPKFDGQVI